ncbi:MAG: hypothetical protein GY812_04850 [Actinomycetia bacterium]|nr:hypothetical protein [Actinomycetes bacterium]
MSMEDAIGILVFLPAIAVWVMAVVDVATRKDIGRGRRTLTAIVIALVFPLTLLYLLARPPSTVRRGPESAGDPRRDLVRRLETGEASPRDEEWGHWVDLAVEGKVPRTR